MCRSLHSCSLSTGASRAVRWLVVSFKFWSFVLSKDRPAKGWHHFLLCTGGQGKTPSRFHSADTAVVSGDACLTVGARQPLLAHHPSPPALLPSGKEPVRLLLDLMQKSQSLGRLKTIPSPLAARFIFARKEGHFSGAARRVFHDVVFSAPVAPIRGGQAWPSSARSLAIVGPTSSENETCDGGRRRCRPQVGEGLRILLEVNQGTGHPILARTDEADVSRDARSTVGREVLRVQLLVRTHITPHLCLSSVE